MRASKLLVSVVSSALMALAFSAGAPAVRAQVPRALPLSCTLTAAGTCGPFQPATGLPFHVELSGVASASCVLERQLDGSTWPTITVTASGTTTPLYNWTYSGTALSEDAAETQSGVLVRVDCGVLNGSFTSGSLNVRFSQ